MTLILFRIRIYAFCHFELFFPRIKHILVAILKSVWCALLCSMTYADALAIGSNKTGKCQAEYWDATDVYKRTLVDTTFYLVFKLAWFQTRSLYMWPVPTKQGASISFYISSAGNLCMVSDNHMNQYWFNFQNMLLLNRL